MRKLIDLTFFTAIIITSIFGVLFLISNHAAFKTGLIQHLTQLF